MSRLITPLALLRFNTKASIIATLLAVVVTLTVLATEPMQAQFSDLHNFTGGGDGGFPNAGLTVGGSGTLYGTATMDGAHGVGLVFKLSERNLNWTLNPLYAFTDANNDGSGPNAGVVIGPNGALYGTTSYGGTNLVGTVFELRPPLTVCVSTTCPWNETVLYDFMAGADGANPYLGNVVFDHAGNMYGTTAYGGAPNCGTVWKLSPSGGGWTEAVLYTFAGGIGDGCNPYSGVVFDAAGNIYGNTSSGGASGDGTIYQLMPMNGGWVEHTIVDLNNGTTGAPTFGTLAIDQAGNLYGTGENFGPQNGGTVFEVSPSAGGWMFSLVYSSNDCFPYPGVTIGPDGNLYGTCQHGGPSDAGLVFEMPPNCNQTCTPTDLHDFDVSDGLYPHGPVTFDASGNLYGTTYEGGGHDNCGGFTCGVAFEIAGVGSHR